jgi:hypothetical protein
MRQVLTLLANRGIHHPDRGVRLHSLAEVLAYTAEGSLCG